MSRSMICTGHLTLALGHAYTITVFDMELFERSIPIFRHIFDVYSDWAASFAVIVTISMIDVLLHLSNATFSGLYKRLRSAMTSGH